MAISKYIQQCDYRIGGLKPYIYLIHKNAMSINFKAKGVDVNFKKTKDSDVYKINASLCTYEQDETYANKYKFANTLEVSLNEQFREPFLYGLRTLRTNQYYIIIEDKKGVQYLINPELYTVLNYEYTFGDTNDSTNGVTITWTNINNHPLLIMEERIESNLVLLGEECPYNIGSVNSLMMASFNDLKVNDDGVVADKLYVEDYTKIYSIDYLKKSFNLTETYDGNMFRTTMSFSIPLEENQFNWHYNLIEFKDNIYKAVVGTTNENYLILGVEKGLSAKYNITTSEDENNLNLINITFTQLSQYPIVYTNDITQYRWFEDGAMCFGFDKYQMLTQQYSEDWGETWITSDPIEKKKGDIIESDSEECKEYQWIDDGTYCYTTDVEYIDYRETTSYVCENGNKYKKLQKYSSTDDGKSYQAQEEYIKGDLVEEDSEDCNYIAIRWIDTNGYMCYPVNEDLTRWDITGTQCSGTTLYNTTKELVTNNGTTYYESGVNKLGDIVKENCCACGYINTEYRYDSTVCSNVITETSFTETRKYNIIREWNVDTFTIKGEGTYIIIPDLLNNKSYNYIALSHLDTDLKLTATTSTSTATTSNYNRGVYYYGTSTYGTWSFTINDDLEHTFQVGTYLNSTSSSYSGETAVVTVTSPKQNYSLYDKYYLWEYCYDEYETVDRQTETYKYELKEYHSCDCEWTGTTWQWDGKETICGSNIEGLDSTSEYEVWRETDCDGVIGNVDYRNPKKSCKCDYVDVITKTEEGFIQLTRRKHSDGVYINEEYEGASDELYDYRANITYSGNACLGDNIVWEISSYEITQEYVEEQVSEVIQVPLLFTVTDLWDETEGYFDVNGNVYNIENVPYWREVYPIENGVGVVAIDSMHLKAPKCYVESIDYEVYGSCSNNNYTHNTSVSYYTDKEGGIDKIKGDGSITLPEDNDVVIFIRVGSTCSVSAKFTFNVNDDRLFDVNSLNTYEVINGKKILLRSLIDFNGYTYRTIDVEYDENDSSTYIEDENGFRYYKIIEQFSLDGNTYYDYTNGYAIKGDMIEFKEEWFKGDVLIKSNNIGGTVSYAYNYTGGEVSINNNGYGIINIEEPLTSCYYFLTSTTVTYVYFNDSFDTSNVTKMDHMFQRCYNLKTLNVSNLNTSKVTTMDSMFMYCDGLTSLDLSNFNTSNVTDMEYMFYSCDGLTSIDLSGWDTSNVTNMQEMFGYCISLTSIDLSGWDTSNATDMSGMFNKCKSLTSLDVSNFDTSKVTDISSMFNECSGLTSLDLSNFDTSNVNEMQAVFAGCSMLTSLDLSGWNTKKVRRTIGMFSSCKSLTTLNVSNWDTSNVLYSKDMVNMFAGCESLVSLILGNVTQKQYDWWYRRLADAYIQNKVTITYNII